MLNYDMSRLRLTNHLLGFGACFLAISSLFINVFPVFSAEIMLSDGKITIAAEGEPLNKVMAGLGKSLGCKVIAPNLSSPVNISRVNADVETVLRELLRGYQYVVYWNRNPTNFQRRVEKIIVISDKNLPNSSMNAQVSIHSEETLDSENAFNLDKTEISTIDRKIAALSNAVGTASEYQSFQLALQDPSVEVRMAALEIIGTLPDSEARLLIQLALEDSDPGIREAAKEMQDALQSEAASDESNDADIDSASVDGRIAMLSNALGTASEYQSFQLALQDPSVEVRMAAMEWLGALPDSEARPLIHLALEDSDPEIRDAAKEALVQLNEINSVR